MKGAFEIISLADDMFKNVIASGYFAIGDIKNQ